MTTVLIISSLILVAALFSLLCRHRLQNILATLFVIAITSALLESINGWSGFPAGQSIWQSDSKLLPWQMLLLWLAFVLGPRELAWIILKPRPLVPPDQGQSHRGGDGSSPLQIPGGENRETASPPRQGAIALNPQESNAQSNSGLWLIGLAALLGGGLWLGNEWLVGPPPNSVLWKFFAGKIAEEIIILVAIAPWLIRKSAQSVLRRQK